MSRTVPTIDLLPAAVVFLIFLLPAVPAAASPADESPDGAVAHSSFRDPFWPVGYVPESDLPPPEPEAAVAAPAPAPVAKATAARPKDQPDWKKALARLRISGYAESDTGLKSCVIDDKTVSEGEVVSVEYGKFKYSWRVEKIAPAKPQMRFTRQGAVLLKK